MFKKKNKPDQKPITRNNYLQTVQHKWADYLHKKTSNWKRSEKIIFLISIYLLIGGSSIYCLINISNNISAFKNLSKMPGTKYHAKPPIEITEPFNLQLDSQLLDQFNKKYDSLMQTDTGRKQIDSFKKTRPGFFDSLKNTSSLFNHFIIP